MSARAFFDTTVLIYSVSDEPRKAAIAEEILSRGGVISVQVLNEFTAVARRKLKRSWPEIRQALAAIRDLCDPPVPVVAQTHEMALTIAESLGFHIYDATILSAAIENSCSILYSEDMQHGQTVQGVVIRNPFA